MALAICVKKFNRLIAPRHTAFRAKKICKRCGLHRTRQQVLVDRADKMPLAVKTPIFGLLDALKRKTTGVTPWRKSGRLFFLFEHYPGCRDPPLSS